MKPIKGRIYERVVNARILSGIHTKAMELHYQGRVTSLGLDAFYKVVRSQFKDAINAAD